MRFAKCRKFFLELRHKRAARKGARFRHLPEGIHELAHQRFVMNPQIKKWHLHRPIENQSISACRITRAGLPATTAPAGTSLVTTLPAPIVAPSPIVTPQRIVALEPIEARRFTSVGVHCQSASVCSAPDAVVARGKRSLMN